jgi:hypothetical protein
MAPLPALQIQSPPVAQRKDTDDKQSKGIKIYPPGWFNILTITKDLVRASMALSDAFPGPHVARVMANEVFHEVLATQRAKGAVLEPGTSTSFDSPSLVFSYAL